MRLLELLSNVGYTIISGDPRIEVSGLAWDSRRVEPRQVFVAIRGTCTDGHQFLHEAFQRGAWAAVVERDAILPTFPLTKTIVAVENSREALAWMAAAWHGHPARRLRVIGVTGTDGKTTTVNLIWSILRAAGHRVGMISTVNAQIGPQFFDTGLHTTTPDAPEVQRYLAEMVQAGMDYAVLEATSHGLAQERVTGCEQDVAVVTNITHEHLDFHGDYEGYREAKARLFRGLSTAYHKPGVPKVAVLNHDDSSFEYLAAIPVDVRYAYGLSVDVDFTAEELSLEPDGSRFRVCTPSGSFDVCTPLVGRFNVYNVLAAAAAGFSQGASLAQLQEGIEAVHGVAGRMERIDRGQDFVAIVDFAHTPNALERALETVRNYSSGNVIVVFGSAGLRDVAKRGLMGRIAGRLADRIVITAEDPRTENLDAIIAAIAEGVEAEGRREGDAYWRVPDRAEAIQFAVEMAQPGDVVIVCGKGHERSMCFGTTELPWSDHEALEKAIMTKLCRKRPMVPPSSDAGGL